MTPLRAFLHEDKPFLGLYSFQWVFVAIGLTIVLALIFGLPAWFLNVVWYVFTALVAGAAVGVVLFVIVIIGILTVGVNK